MYATSFFFSGWHFKFFLKKKKPIFLKKKKLSDLVLSWRWITGWHSHSSTAEGSWVRRPCAQSRRRRRSLLGHATYKKTEWRARYEHCVSTIRREKTELMEWAWTENHRSRHTKGYSPKTTTARTHARTHTHTHTRTHARTLLNTTKQNNARIFGIDAFAHVTTK